ncbi:hypothetical protein HS041_21455 [Planomonospora sp. ID67723]|uniref:hypothetical protein n=1 Tax=Planomonospora sp. ID67723 TaxID=2738134 RepID=UPI0018C3BB58|nr:hypothetical protein [Planomonospora sp. ID67723]MBG0830336.1 hypothetical protein [Planomonospora sp. ID67723]
MDDVEPLKLPPMVLHRGETPAFLLRWRRTEADGRITWWGELAILQPHETSGGDPVTQRWVEAGEIVKLPDVDYSGVPAPVRRSSGAGQT